jgi:uncharacterized repeat protein (TIGR01451 family)
VNRYTLPLRKLCHYLLSCGLWISGLSAYGQATYYAAANGDDSNTGLSADRPIKSIAQINKLVLQPGDRVLLRRGDTFRGELTIRYAGTESQPIVFDAYGDGTKPVVSGSIPVGGWTQTGPNSWQASCERCGSRVTGLYGNDKALPLGRYPNASDPNKGYLTIQSHQGSTQITSRQAIPLDLNTSWKGAEVVLRSTQWITNRYAFISQSGSQLNVASPNSGYGIQDGWGYFVQNHPAALDQDGEWAYDPATKVIRLYSTGSNPNNQLITATIFDKACSLSNVHHVQVTNLAMAQALGTNLFVLNGSDIRFANLAITNAGEDGMAITGSGQNVVIENSLFENVNNNGLWIAAYPNVTVRNNVLRKIGVTPGRSKNDDGQGNGIQTYVEQAMLIENNRIDSIGYNAISYTNGTTIRNNVIANFCVAKSDGGGLYTWNGNKKTMNGIHLVSNIIYNGIGPAEGTPGTTNTAAHGIYFDDCSQNAEARGNTIFNCSGLGIFLHSTTNIIVAENVSYNNGEGQLALTDNHGLCLPRSNAVQGNVLASRLPNQFVAKYESENKDLPDYGTFDNNYYIRPFEDVFKIRAVYRDGSTIGADLSLGEWQTKFAKDQNSSNCPLTFNDYTITSTGASLLTNTFGTSSDGWSNWSPYNNCRTDWDNTNKLDAGSLRVSFPVSSNQTNSYAIATNGIGSVNQGKSYYLKFDAIASSSTKRVEVFFRQRDASYQDVTPRKVLLIGQQRKAYEMVLTASVDEKNAILVFQVLEDGQTVWFDNVRLQEVVKTAVNPDNYIKLVYNPTNRDSTVLLDDRYRSAQNIVCTASVRLAPFTSMLLLKDPLAVAESKPALQADLNLSMNISKQALSTGQPVTVQLRLYNEQKLVNTGAVSAQWVCRLPPNLQIVTSDGLNYADGVLQGSVENLGVGGERIATFQVKPTQPGTYRLTAQVATATLTDPDSKPGSGTGDGEDDASMACFRTTDSGNALFESPNPDQQPLPQPLSGQPAVKPDLIDLSLGMSLSNRTPALNELVTCTLWVNNAGSVTAGALTIENQLPAGLDFVGGANWSASGKLLTISLGNLPPGGTVSTSFQARVTTRDQLINKAQISYADKVDVDSTPGNGFNNGEDDQAMMDIRVK